MKDIISTEALINKFTDMANRGTLLIGSEVTQPGFINANHWNHPCSFRRN